MRALRLDGDESRDTRSASPVSRAPNGHSGLGAVSEQGKVFIQFAWPYSMDGMRGGGTKNVGERILGAGVLDWLEDSDYESEELAERERRRSETMLLSAPSLRETQQGPGGIAGTLSSSQCGTTEAPRMTITGRSGETSITVCPRCMRDVPTADWAKHTCAQDQRYRLTETGHVHRMISEWEARSARDGAHGAMPQAHGQAQVISIAEALGIQEAVQTAPAACNGTARVISIAQALGVEGLRSPRGQARGQWFEMGLADMAGLTTQPETPEAAVGEEEGPSDDWRTWGRDACQNCGMTSAHGVLEWRICRCRAWYCAACASGQCVHCPAARVWVDPEVAGRVEMRADFMNDPRDAMTVDPTTDVAAPRKISPDEAQAARIASMRTRKERLDEKRADRREMARAHTRQGLRPGRERNRDGEIMVASANVTCTTSLKEELEHGVELRRAHHILLQEHKLRGEYLEAATTWAARRGWDAHINEAYIKEARPGGGTAVISRDTAGVRPMPAPPTELEGRCTMGAIDVNGSITVVAWYGITGGCLAQQLPLWQTLATLLRMHGLPFVVGGATGKSRPTSSRARACTRCWTPVCARGKEPRTCSRGGGSTSSSCPIPSWLEDGASNICTARDSLPIALQYSTWTSVGARRAACAWRDRGPSPSIYLSALGGGRR